MINRWINSVFPTSFLLWFRIFRFSCQLMYKLGLSEFSMHSSTCPHGPYLRSAFIRYLYYFYVVSLQFAHKTSKFNTFSFYPAVVSCRVWDKRTRLLKLWGNLGSLRRVHSLAIYSIACCSSTLVPNMWVIVYVDNSIKNTYGTYLYSLKWAWLFHTSAISMYP